MRRHLVEQPGSASQSWCKISIALKGMSHTLGTKEKDVQVGETGQKRSRDGVQTLSVLVPKQVAEEKSNNDIDVGHDRDQDGQTELKRMRTGVGSHIATTTTQIRPNRESEEQKQRLQS